MQIKKFNISKPKKYTDGRGQEKTQWNNIGTITGFYKDDASVSRIIEIPAIGLEANIFPLEQVSRTQDREIEQEEYPTEDKVNVDDIPEEEIPF